MKKLLGTAKVARLTAPKLLGTTKLAKLQLLLLHKNSEGGKDGLCSLYHVKLLGAAIDCKIQSLLL